MKKVSNHLGEIIVAVACVALLISAITVFSAPISSFYSSITGKLTSEGSKLLTGFESVPEVGVAGSVVNSSASGKALFLSDVNPVQHDLDVTLTSDTISDFSDVTVSRTGNNLLDVDNISKQNKVANLTIDSETGSIRYTKDCAASTYSTYVSTNAYLPAGSYTLTMNSEEESNDRLAVHVIKDSDKIGEYYYNYVGTHSNIIEIAEDGNYEFRFAMPYAAELNDIFSVSYIQLERGAVATEYQKYNSQTVKANSDGTVDGLTSVSPSMLLSTDNSDVTIKCNYQKKK